MNQVEKKDNNATYEKALEWILYSETAIDESEMKEIRNLVIAALEKQIAKEPVFENNCVAGDGETPTGCPVCPTCKEPTYSLQWCAFCGQHLKLLLSY